MNLYLVIGHVRGCYEEDYNLICVCDNEKLAKQVVDTNADFDSYEIQPCELNEVLL